MNDQGAKDFSQFHCGAEDEFSLEGWKLEKSYIGRQKLSYQIGKLCSLGLKAQITYPSKHTTEEAGFAASFWVLNSWANLWDYTGPKLGNKGSVKGAQLLLFPHWSLLQTKERASALWWPDHLVQLSAHCKVATPNCISVILPAPMGHIIFCLHCCELTAFSVTSTHSTA